MNSVIGIGAIVIRWGIAAGFVWNIYHEAGLYTATFAAVMFIYTEMHYGSKQRPRS